MAKPKLTLYYDIGSPFAYMAFHVIRTSSVFSQCDLTYSPILLGGLFRSSGNRPPLEIKNKDKWMEAERKRWAARYNIPIADTVPDGFPISTLLIQRTLTAINLASPDKLVPATEAIYKAFWAERNAEKVNEAPGLTKVLSQVFSEAVAKDLVQKSSSDEVKKALTKITQKAFDEGAFGAPFWVATNTKGESEVHWGFDHLGQVVDFLGLERPQTESGWRAML